MITEDYISFEVAKILKEKGFDERCSGFYQETKRFCLEGNYRNIELEQ